MEIFDSTLRDGEQAAGVYLTPEQKASYAKLLEISGVDIIDSGFPFASKTDWEGVRAVAAATKKVTISAVATHLKKDIDNVRLALKGHESRSRLATRIGPEHIKMEEGDAVIFMNFRSDRARELTLALTDHDFTEFKPPSFVVEDISEAVYRLHYRSSRKGLESFVVGILKGIRKRFDTNIEIEVESREELEVGDHVIFELKFPQLVGD